MPKNSMTSFMEDPPKVKLEKIVKYYLPPDVESGEYHNKEHQEGFLM